MKYEVEGTAWSLRRLWYSCDKCWNRAKSVQGEARRTTSESVGLETLHPGQKHVRPFSLTGWQLAQRGMEHEDVSLFLISPSVGCKLTAESGTPVVRLSSPWTLFARFQHLSHECHRWRVTIALHFTWWTYCKGSHMSWALVPPCRGRCLAGAMAH